MHPMETPHINYVEKDSERLNQHRLFLEEHYTRCFGNRHTDFLNCMIYIFNRIQYRKLLI